MKHIKLSFKKHHTIQSLGLFLDKRLNLTEALEIILISSLEKDRPMERQKGFQPQEDSLMVGEVLRLELDNNLSE